MNELMPGDPPPRLMTRILLSHRLLARPLIKGVAIREDDTLRVEIGLKGDPVTEQRAKLPIPRVDE
jgi:hypothetical protein